MDGRWWGLDGGLVASRPAACVKDALPTALLHAIASVQIRIAYNARLCARSAQYAGDTVVTSPVDAARRVLSRNPMKNKTLASAVVDLAA
jgi:hypothetical protein